MPYDPKRTERYMTTLAESGRAAAETRIRESVGPTAPCERCGGRGFLEAPAFVGTCPGCRGLGCVFLSPEQHERRRLLSALRARAELEASRKRYALVRALVCVDGGIARDAFERAVRRILGAVRSAPESPQHWVDAAERVASLYGVEVPREKTGDPTFPGKDLKRL